MHEQPGGSRTVDEVWTTRRTSLMGLGAVALATLAGRVSNSDAKKKGKRRKSKGDDRKRCRAQVPACEELLTAVCAELGPLCEGSFEDDLLPCCAFLAECRAGEMITCASAYFNPND